MVHKSRWANTIEPKPQIGSGILIRIRSGLSPSVMEFRHISPTRGVVDYTTSKELHLSSCVNLKGTKIFNTLLGSEPKTWLIEG